MSEGYGHKPISVPLDPEGMVATWVLDSASLINPNAVKTFENQVFAGWYQSGRVRLKAARDNWEWRQKNMGKKFPSSIYYVSPTWIFPDGYEVASDWLEREKERATPTEK